jgi:hypothetical protein
MLKDLGIPYAGIAPTWSNVCRQNLSDNLAIELRESLAH